VPRNTRNKYPCFVGWKFSKEFRRIEGELRSINSEDYRECPVRIDDQYIRDVRLLLTEVARLRRQNTLYRVRQKAARKGQQGDK
jgi:hypothetical protein